MTTAIYIACAFAIGFLLGDRRGVKQANEILDENMKVLLNAITDERTIPVDELEGDRPTVH